MFKLVVLLAALLAVNAVPLNEIFELINEDRTCPEYGGMKDIDTLKVNYLPSRLYVIPANYSKIK